MDFVIFQLGSRQYLIKSGQTIEVDRLPDGLKKLPLDKILLLTERGKIEIGKPYLKKTYNLEILENIKKPKMRVATYKAKSNYRRVIGQRREVSVVRLSS